MRAVSLRQGRLALRELPDPVAGPGQVLVRTLACAICASDHHYMDHPEVSREDRSGMRVDAPDQDVVMGHEFCAEVVAYGPDTRAEWPVGTRVTSIPALFGTEGMRVIGMAPDAPGGFGELFLLSEGFVRPVPEDVPVEHIALTDALAVGWYYTRVGVEGAPARGAVPLVLGLGAIGLSVVMALKERGSGPIVAVDYAAARRALAAELGADVVVDPAERATWEVWREVAWGGPEEVHDRIRLSGLPTCTAYEMVGRDGVLASIVDECPIGTRVLSCGGAARDEIRTTVAHTKGLNLQIGGGPMPDDWYATLDLVIEGRLDPAPLVGERVPLEGLADAIDRARRPDAPVRMLYVADGP